MSANTRRSAKRRSHAEVFAALGDETRLALLRQLYAGKARSITELSADAVVTRQAVTKHLRTLETAGLVRCRREGRESLFSFNPEPMSELQEYMATVSRQWDAALARLKAFAETG